MAQVLFIDGAVRISVLMGGGSRMSLLGLKRPKYTFNVFSQNPGRNTERTTRVVFSVQWHFNAL